MSTAHGVAKDPALQGILSRSGQVRDRFCELVQGTRHRNGAFDGFSKKYNRNRLLYVEPFELMLEAIAHDKQLKGWRRKKKFALMRTTNPAFQDLAETWGWKMMNSQERMN